MSGEAMQAGVGGDGTLPEGIKAGMTISVRTRRDVVIVDPERFLAAARQAVRDLDPTLSEEQAAGSIHDLLDAVHALLDRDGQLANDQLLNQIIEFGRGGLGPGKRVLDRPDGLSPAGWIQEIVPDEPQPLQDYGCFLPENPFSSSSASTSTE
ncbi:MAG TPA: hypothetical protein VF062_10220 [Candidatus Limnocylindrales bacterium]